MGCTPHNSTTWYRHGESRLKERLSGNDILGARTMAKTFLGWHESEAARAEQELLNALRNSGGYDSRGPKNKSFRSNNWECEPTDAIRHFQTGLGNAFKNQDQ